MDPKQRLISEFRMYYNADELPPNDERWKSDTLSLWTAQSAHRLRSLLEEADRRELAAVLRSASQDQDHPLVDALEDATNVAWTFDEQTWEQLVGILEGIAGQLID